VQIDLNHPLARSPVSVAARILEEKGYAEEHGGRCNDIVTDVLNGGVGLQAAMPEGHKTQVNGATLARLDPREDALFYSKPRLVQHLDSSAIAGIGEIYRRLLKPGMKVLDFMSSWVSHLPEDLTDITVTGLGMNAEELRQNPRLASHVVHDVNLHPRLPFEDATFDAIICTASVEYLVSPMDVFSELGRVLKPGAPLIITFSNRWFPPKAIRIWGQAHEFERIGLVLEYFINSGAFAKLRSYSLLVIPRPVDDKYAGQLLLSDPVYAAWGSKRYQWRQARPLLERA